LYTLLILVVALVVFAYARYGGGKPYPADISSAPKLGKEALETVIAYPEPIGNVAASNDTAQQQRVFFTVHPESRPERIKLLEVVGGDGYWYLADSAIPHQMLQSKEHITANKPYYIFRFKM
jgi:hypothetical protein